MAYLRLCLVACLFLGCDRPNDSAGKATTPEPKRTIAALPAETEAPSTGRTHAQESLPNPSPPIVASARSQIGKTTIYDGAYVGLDYPGGDVPLERGVCTDVVIRSLRDAHQIDLQQQVHEDMKRAFSKYPTIWGLSGPDRNIDHRRVPNLQTYFTRMGYAIPRGTRPADFKPGDLVTCMVGNRPHIMVVSDRTSSDGTPLVIHNIGRGTQEEDRLLAFTLTGQYRIKLQDEQ